MPEEMLKFRNALEVRGVEWINNSNNFDRSFPFLDMIVYATVFRFNDSLWTVKSGFGTFGGDRGLLELRVDDGELVGSLTAQDVLRMMDDV